MNIVPYNTVNGVLNAPNAVLSYNGRLMVDSSGAAGSINVKAINTGSTLGSMVYADSGMLMVEAVSIDFEHWRIHAGKSFVASATNTGVSNGATINVRFSPSGETAHMVFNVASEGKSRCSLIENPTTLTDGDSISGCNANRTSAHTTASVIMTGVTYSGGTALLRSTIFGGTGPQSIGASEAGRQEWMLKTGNHYVLSITNAAGSAKDIDVLLEWYEAGPNYHGAGW